MKLRRVEYENKKRLNDEIGHVKFGAKSEFGKSF